MIASFLVFDHAALRRRGDGGWNGTTGGTALWAPYLRSEVAHSVDVRRWI